MRKKKNSKLRSALAIFLAGAMVLGMIPGGMGQVYASDSTPTPALALMKPLCQIRLTVDTWNQVVKDSTENIGRIWTDKTVLTEDIQLEGGSRPSVKKGDSDFLVGLSALSSTSNTVKTVSRPLDIVLVVDTSGSMENSPAYGKLGLRVSDIDMKRYMQEILVKQKIKNITQRMEAKLLLKVKKFCFGGNLRTGN